MSIPLIPLSIVLLFVAYKLYQRFLYKLPPGPRPWPLVGNLFQIKPVRYRCFAEWAKVYGPIMSVWVGPNLNIVVSSPQLAREVLQEHDQKLADRHRSRATNKFSRNGQDLVWADYGPHYVKLRKFSTVELFSQKRIEALRPIREDEITSMAESIFKDCTNPENSGKSFEIKKYLGTVVFNNITRIVFGKRFVNSDGVMDEQGIEFKAIMANEFKLAGSVMLGELFPWLRWMKPLDEEAFAKHEARRERLTKAIFDEHKLARQRNEGATKQHFVDALLNWQDKYEFSEDTVVGLLWDMILAGMDTVAIVTEWSMAEMIKNPRVQQKVQEELDRVVGKDRVMTESDIPNLPYLQCVVKECLRLHPSTPLMLPHCASEDVTIGGYNIPKGTTVLVNVWAIARDPAYWKDPLEFRPERFLEEDVDVKGHDFRLIPFGAGRRVCAGAQIAIYMVTSLLGHLLHQFSWAPPYGLKPNEIDMSDNPGMITFMKTPLHGVPTPRLPSHVYKRVASDS